MKNYISQEEVVEKPKSINLTSDNQRLQRVKRIYIFGDENKKTSKLGVYGN